MSTIAVILLLVGLYAYAKSECVDVRLEACRDAASKHVESMFESQSERLECYSELWKQSYSLALGFAIGIGILLLFEVL